MAPVAGEGIQSHGRGETTGERRWPMSGWSALGLRYRRKSRVSHSDRLLAQDKSKFTYAVDRVDSTKKTKGKSAIGVHAVPVSTWLQRARMKRVGQERMRSGLLDVSAVIWLPEY